MWFRVSNNRHFSVLLIYVSMRTWCRIVVFFFSCCLLLWVPFNLVEGRVSTSPTSTTQAGLLKVAAECRILHNELKEPGASKTTLQAMRTSLVVVLPSDQIRGPGGGWRGRGGGGGGAGDYILVLWLLPLPHLHTLHFSILHRHDREEMPLDDGAGRLNEKSLPD